MNIFKFTKRDDGGYWVLNRHNGVLVGIAIECVFGSYTFWNGYGSGFALQRGHPDVSGATRNAVAESLLSRAINGRQFASIRPGIGS